MDAEELLELLINFDFVVVREEDISLLLLMLFPFFLKLCPLNMPELIKSAIRHLITLLTRLIIFPLKLLKCDVMLLQVLGIHVAWHVVLLELSGLYD